MLKQYESLRNNIRNIRINNKDYKKCISMCNNYLKELDSLNLYDSDDKRFCYYEMALDYKKLGNYKESIKYNLIAMNYLQHVEDKIDYKLINSKWLMAECWAELSNKEEALKLYSECSKMYRTIGEESLRTLTIWNKAKLYKNDKTMLKLVQIYKTKTLQSVVKTYGDITYNSVLSEMYSDLFQLYKVLDMQKAYQLLYILEDKRLRKELALKLRCA
jgi:tetratricopeptide (TPR) repeat protein